MENILQSDTRAALTGPIRRGDIGTVRGHLAAVEEAGPERAGCMRPPACEHRVGQTRRVGGIGSGRTCKDALGEFSRT